MWWSHRYSGGLEPKERTAINRHENLEMMMSKTSNLFRGTLEDRDMLEDTALEGGYRRHAQGNPQTFRSCP